MLPGKMTKICIYTPRMLCTTVHTGEKKCLVLIPMTSTALCFETWALITQLFSFPQIWEMFFICNPPPLFCSYITLHVIIHFLCVPYFLPIECWTLSQRIYWITGFVSLIPISDDSYTNWNVVKGVKLLLSHISWDFPLKRVSTVLSI